MVKGIGPHFARTLVRAFGERVFDVIEDNPDQLLTLPGIGPKRKERVTRAWAEQKVIREIMVFLQSHGVGTARAVRIYKTYGDEAIARVTENPYRLALDIHGIGFKTADAIAQRLGIPKDSLIRAQAGVRHVLQEIAGQGHCAAYREVLAEQAADLLEIPPPIIAQAIAAELALENLVEEPIEDRPALFLAPLQRAEQGVAASLRRLSLTPAPWGTIDAGRAIPWVESQTGIQLSASQRDAVAAAVNGKVTVITGGPGVGKTTVVNSILRILAARGVEMLLCAPTGRAAKRLAESTGREARTIHRLLEFDPQTQGFKRDQYSPLDTDLVVVDECSMVDVVADEPAPAGHPQPRRPAPGGGRGPAPLGGSGDRARGPDRIRDPGHGAPHRDLPPGGRLPDHRQRPPDQRRADAGGAPNHGGGQRLLPDPLRHARAGPGPADAGGDRAHPRALRPGPGRRGAGPHPHEPGRTRRPLAQRGAAGAPEPQRGAPQSPASAGPMHPGTR